LIISKTTENVSINLSNREQTKIKNLYKAVIGLFTDPFKLDFNLNYFTVDLAKHLHFEICKNLIINTGIYKKNQANPSKVDFEYSKPDEIDTNMYCLLKEIRHRFFKPNLSLENKIKVGVYFFGKFLTIHTEEPADFC